VNKKLSELIEYCRLETERFMRQENYDAQACWEIWRQAVVEQRSEAWEAVIKQYDLLVRRWLRVRLSSAPWLRQDEDFLLNAAFTKFYRFVDAAKFSNFPNLAALLRYLQMCISSVVTDELRDYQARKNGVSLEASFNSDDDANSEATNNTHLARLSSSQDIEQEVIDKSERLSLWERIKQVVPDKVDQLLLYLDFVQQLPPREIVKVYPQYFPTVGDVYRRRKNLLWRLRNNAAFREFVV
jgi:hypothetical protein